MLFVPCYQIVICGMLYDSEGCPIATLMRLPFRYPFCVMSSGDAERKIITFPVVNSQRSLAFVAGRVFKTSGSSASSLPCLLAPPLPPSSPALARLLSPSACSPSRFLLLETSAITWWNPRAPRLGVLTSNLQIFFSFFKKRKKDKQEGMRGL